MLSTRKSRYVIFSLNPFMVLNSSTEWYHHSTLFWYKIHSRPFSFACLHKNVLHFLSLAKTSQTVSCTMYKICLQCCSSSLSSLFSKMNTNSCRVRKYFLLKNKKRCRKVLLLAHPTRTVGNLNKTWQIEIW